MVIPSRVMSTRVRIPAPVRERRSHAERTAETRARVMAAVVESIAEVGFQKTTANEIARRAGVTWGAAQHHFGDKDGILMAVLEESFSRFADVLGEAPEDDVALSGRVSLFVDRAAEHFASDHYRSTFEILLNLPEGSDLGWQQEMLSAWFGLWNRYFPVSRTSQQHTVDLMHYMISVLSGLAAMKMLEGPPGRGIRTRDRELQFLKQTLERELAG
jgi:AcrR family transcriptional regulator